jgi:hypothetical protein
MKNFHTATIFISSAVLLSFAASAAGAKELVRPTLTAEQCQPLSPNNVDLCCMAMNRNNLLTATQIDQCPPLTTARLRAALAKSDVTGSIPTPSIKPDQPGNEPGAVPAGQPGSDPAKANSGAGNGAETGTGEHASSDTDPGNSGGHNNSPDSPAGQN